MKTPEGADGPVAAAHTGSATSSAQLEEELAAERDFETGNYIELSHEQLVRCMETGESPWPDESQD